MNAVHRSCPGPHSATLPQEARDMAQPEKQLAGPCLTGNQRGLCQSSRAAEGANRPPNECAGNHHTCSAILAEPSQSTVSPMRCRYAASAANFDASRSAAERFLSASEDGPALLGLCSGAKKTAVKASLRSSNKKAWNKGIGGGLRQQLLLDCCEIAVTVRVL